MLWFDNCISFSFEWKMWKIEIKSRSQNYSSKSYRKLTISAIFSRSSYLWFVICDLMASARLTKLNPPFEIRLKTFCHHIFSVHITYSAFSIYFIHFPFYEVNANDIPFIIDTLTHHNICDTNRAKSHSGWC